MIQAVIFDWAGTTVDYVPAPCPARTGCNGRQAAWQPPEAPEMDAR